MLKLRLAPGEHITITLPDGQVIRVELRRLGKLKSEIGVEAPRDVHISRPERGGN